MQTVLGGGDGFDIRTSVSGDNDLNTSVPVYLYHCGADNCTSVSGDDGFNTPVPVCHTPLTVGQILGL